MIKRLGLIALSVVMLMGCSSDDDGGSDDTSADLVGTWRITSLTYNGDVTTEFQGTSTSSTFDGEAINIDAIIVLTENPNEFTGSGSYDVVLTSETAGQSTTQTVPIDDFESEGTWSRSGNTLSTNGSLVSVSSPADVFGDMMTSGDSTIEELTETTLRLSNSDSQEITQDGLTLSTTANSTVVFTRE